MKKMFAILAILIMALGASTACFAASSETSNTETVSSQANPGLSMGAKIGISVGAGCVISLIIVCGMMASMNTAREASQADFYYGAEDVKVAVSEDKYTHTTRKEIPKGQQRS